MAKKCGCSIVVNARNTLAPTIREYERAKISYCLVHASAAELLAALEVSLDMAAAWAKQKSDESSGDAMDCEEADTARREVKRLQGVILKAKGAL